MFQGNATVAYSKLHENRHNFIREEHTPPRQPEPAVVPGEEAVFEKRFQIPTVLLPDVDAIAAEPVPMHSATAAPSRSGRSLPIYMNVSFLVIQTRIDSMMRRSLFRLADVLRANDLLT